MPPAHAVLAAPLLPLPPVEHQGGHLVVVAQGAARHVHQVAVLSVDLSNDNIIRIFDNQNCEQQA